MLDTIAVVVAALLLTADKPVTSADWMPLVKNRDYAKAKVACEAWLNAPDAGTRAEAHKCLANVDLGAAGEHKMRIEGDKSGGFIGSGYDAEPALSAIRHLDAAVKLAPQDLSIHQGRLHVLELASMYGQMPAALKESVGLYKGKDALDAWLAYPDELFGRRQFKVAEEFLLILETRYPGDHRVAGDLAAVYGMMERDVEALGWANKAVKLAPNDPIDTWNLARIYDFTGKVELADAAYQRALSLQPPQQLAQSQCAFAEFLEKRRKDAKRACDLQRQAHCPTSACQP